jgi:CDP-diacylglycerol---glycerol-3-phosphate 3-phosphatidyltransferase
MSANPPNTRPRAHRVDSIVPDQVKQAGRGLLAPLVRGALAIGLTANTVTVMGLGVVLIGAALIAQGQLLAGAAVLLAGSLLDAVDGTLARASGGTTAFGGFLDSTLDRIAEAAVYIAVVVNLLTSQPDPIVPVLGALLALGGSFVVSYIRARAEAIGAHAEVGLAPRTERLALIIIGLALAGLGWAIALVAALWIIAVLSLATVVQRIWHVWRQTGAPQPAAADEKEKED